jgi:glucose/arabinose dehydrogenase
MARLRRFVQLCVALIGSAQICFAEEKAPDSYTITPYAIPDGIKLEASGLAVMPDGKLAVSSRRGEVWILDHPEADPAKADQVGFHRFASGMHEVLGLAWHDVALFAIQRSEVTRLRDTDGDGVADEYLSAAKGWGVSGNYHEYAYGPVFDQSGTMWITLNSTLGAHVKMAGQRATEFPWRGWAMIMRPGEALEPLCGGLRSPSGIGLNAEGDVFCTDQQGNWFGTNPLLHLRKGAFFGHGDSVKDMRRPESPVKDPGKLPQEITVVEAAKRVPGLVPPAVWFPYVKMGQSPTGLVCDMTGGKFGPFEKQLFVGEFVLSGVNRVFLEKVDGEYQGACFHFADGLECGALRLAFLPDGSLVVGETNRGWNSQGSRSFGLERIRWTGKEPFEILKMEARKDGFELTFTGDLDVASAADPSAYEMSSYTYIYHEKYGSDEVDAKPVPIVRAEVGIKNRSVRLYCNDLRTGYVHELHVRGMKNDLGVPLGHAEAYYTLNRLPN